MAGRARKTSKAKTEPETTTEIHGSEEDMTTAVEDYTQESDVTPETPEEPTKRTRAPIDTGTVMILPSEDQESSGRNTRLDTDPVPVAVRDAQDGLWYDVVIEDADTVDADELNKRRDGIKTLLRRAGGHFGKGVNVDPRDYPNKVRFKTGPRRQVKSKKTTSEPETAPEVNMAAADTVEPTETVTDGYDYNAEAEQAQANQGWGYDSNAA